MTTYVFDTEPLLAYLYDEPGATVVADWLRPIETGTARGIISHATAVEIVHKIARLETGSPNTIQPGEDELDVGQRDLRAFQGFGLRIMTPAWDRVARIKASGGISLGDSYAVAIAAEHEGTLIVGTDPEFDELPIDVTIERVDLTPE